jgi:hypothetical protein
MRIFPLLLAVHHTHVVTTFHHDWNIEHILYGSGNPNMWKNYDNNGIIEKMGDPSPGLYMRTCYQYFGHKATRVGREWSTVECKAPFNFVCVAIKGMAEMEDYEFQESYIRGCHFRCPCPDSQPWVEWYRAYVGDEAHRLETAFRRHWEKKCVMQAPPAAYDIGSRTLPFPKHKPIEVRCCKKHWDWIGHPNDTRKHPTTPKFVEDYNRTQDVRIGHWGVETDGLEGRPRTYPIKYLDEQWVMWGADSCNKWQDEDMMLDWDKTAYYEIEMTGVNAGQLTASSLPLWWILSALAVLCALE